ncbi:MAG TPA: pilus assembly protein PilM [Candidatus Eisenbacteria bacterium]|nr:pilus assembly protein PilM [Candidatus Eisenbacteria bacterium]
MSGAQAFTRRLGALLGESSRALIGVERGQGWARVLAPGEPPRAGTSIRELVEALGLDGRSAAAMLEGSEVVVRRLTLPPMKGADLRAALALECRNLIGYPIEEAVIRHEVLGPSVQGTGVDVLVAVAPKRAILESIRALESAGLVPRRLTIRATALRSLLRSARSLDREEEVAYLDLGPRESHITIFRGDEIRFTRECGVGVASFIDALRSIVVPGQGVRLLDAGDAESLLLSHGVVGGGEERPSSEIPASAVLVMLRPSLERLTRELWNSVDYVHEQFHGQTVSKIALLGETARVPGLAAYLAGVLKMPVETVDSESQGGALAWGAVAGLGHLDPGAIDFLEPSNLGPLSRVAEAVQPRVAIAATLVLLLSVSLPAEMSVQRERARVMDLERKLASVAPYADQVVRFREARSEEASSDAVMASLRGPTPAWAEVLRDLSHRVGSDARLLSVALVEPKPEDADAAAAATTPGAVTIRIEGLVKRERLRPEAPLGDLMASLESSPYVDQVALQTCQAMGPAQSRFVLEARLTSGGTP